MTWYTAVLCMRARVGDGWQDDFLIDHQVRVVSASDASAAYETALQLGRADEDAYKNGAGETVRWEFVGLESLAEVADAIRSGTEVHSWRTQGNPNASVVAREDLEAFRPADNRTAREILDDFEGPGA